MQQQMRFVRNLLYKLKRQYGTKVSLYKTTAVDLNPMTGRKNSLRTKVDLRFAIVLPDTLANKFVYDHSYLMANRKFAYGAQFDQRQRLVIVDMVDLPANFEIEVDTYLVFDNSRYVVRKVEKFDVGLGYILTITRADNNLPLQIQELSVLNEFCMGQSAGTS